MIRYFLRALASHVRQGATLYVLTVFGVALGVASVLCIQILNRNALGAFKGSVRALSGDADLSIRGVLPTLDESLLAAVLADAQVEQARPLYRVEVALEGEENFFLEVIGVDLLGSWSAPVSGLLSDPGPEAGGGGQPASASAESLHQGRAWLEAALAAPGWMAISPELARERGWSVGSVVPVSSGSRRVRLVVGALLDFKRASPLASRKMVVMDIAQAQGMLGHRGEIHQIDVLLAEAADSAAAAARLQAALGPSVRAAPPESQLREAENLLGAFRLNLTALSLVSLFVGVFLVYSSTRAALIRRRAEFGVLRCLGAGRGQVLGLMLGEVALLGGLGTLLGIPVGYAAAALNVGLVSQTISSIYLLQEIETLQLPIWLQALAAATGIGGALAGAMLPALDISRKDPRALLAAYSMQRRSEHMALPLASIGGALMALCAIWFVTLGQAWRPAGFVLGVALLIGLPLLCPAAIQLLCRRVPVRRFAFAYSLRSLSLQLPAASFAVAALGVAVAMLVGITLMIASFRSTLVSWLDLTLAADIYVTTPTVARGGAEATLSTDLIAGLATRPEVQRIDRLRRVLARSGDRPLRVAGVDMGLPGAGQRFALQAGDPEKAYRLVAEAGAVLISEPLARKQGLSVGGRLRVDAPDGPIHLPVAGVYTDYGSEQGAAIMDLSTYAEIFGPGPPHSVALYLADGVDAEAYQDTLRAELLPDALSIRSNRSLRVEVMRIFDQTFAVTRILQGMSLLIAVAGITLTLLVMAREKIAELALYRALGASRGQVFAVFLGKGLGMGVLAVVLGVLGGVLLALVLVLVINRAYFGWTLRMAWPWSVVAVQMLVILSAALAAALYPAARASGVPAAELNRDNVAAG